MNFGPEAYGDGGAPTAAFSAADDQDLTQCRDCGRSFNAEAMSKHSRICKKVFASKRKVFNAAGQRLEGEAKSMARE